MTLGPWSYFVISCLPLIVWSKGPGRRVASELGSKYPGRSGRYSFGALSQ